MPDDVRAPAPTRDEQLEQLVHNALIDHDTIVGLMAQLDTLKARIAVLEAADIGKAYARIDLLEDAREAQLDDLRWAIKRHREELAVAHAATLSIKSTTTWKVGSAVVRPLAKLTGRITP